MTDSESGKGESPLWKTLQQISNDLGVYDDQLSRYLVPELQEYWGVDPHEENLRTKVAEYLRQDIAVIKPTRGKLGEERFRQVVEVSFNIYKGADLTTQDRKSLTIRREWLDRRYGLSMSTCQRVLSDALTQIEKLILADPKHTETARQLDAAGSRRSSRSASSRSPNPKWLWAGVVVVVLVLATGAYFGLSTTLSHSGSSSSFNAAQLERRYDGKDPRGTAGVSSKCSDPPPSQLVASSNPPVFGVNGKIVGHMELRTSPICPVIWARVIWNGGPDATYRIPSGWTLHIVAHRPETKTSHDSPDVPSENPIQYGLSSMLVSVRGCVYVEVYFSKSDRRTAVARTSCVKN